MTHTEWKVLPGHIRARRLGTLRTLRNPLGHAAGSVTLPQSLYTNEEVLSYRAARAAWLVAPLVSGTADQNIPLDSTWSDLRVVGAELSVSGLPPRPWNVAAEELRRLAAIPETSVTPEQKALARSLVRRLDAFFATPGLWGPGT